MRPGGLTALSIFNFVFGGLGGLAGLIGIATLGMTYQHNAEQAAKMGLAFPSQGVQYALMTVAIVRAALLITAAIGYLGMRKFLGRAIGNTYAVVALGSIVLEISLARTSFTAFNLVDFVFPLITLFLLNAVFRKDLVR
jgi:hypothetical protein